MIDANGTYRTMVGSQEKHLPLVTLSPQLTIALLISVDHGVEFSTVAGRELAELLAPYDVDVVVSVATMGIPLAIEVSRALGLDDYVILQKTPKIHLADAIAEPVKSITTGARSVCSSTVRGSPRSPAGASAWSTTSSRPGRRSAPPSSFCAVSRPSPSPSAPC